MKLANAADAAKAVKESIKTTEKQIEQLLDRIVDADSPSVIRAYEKRITKLEHERALAVEKLGTGTKPRVALEESFEHAMRFLSSP